MSLTECYSCLFDFGKLFRIFLLSVLLSAYSGCFTCFGPNKINKSKLEQQGLQATARGPARIEPTWGSSRRVASKIDFSQDARRLRLQWLRCLRFAFFSALSRNVSCSIFCFHVLSSMPFGSTLSCCTYGPVSVA